MRVSRGQCQCGIRDKKRSVEVDKRVKIPQTSNADLNCCSCSSSDNCFPATSKVKLMNGKSVPMSELQVGDEVQTGINH